MSKRAELDGVRVVPRATGYLLKPRFDPILLLGAEAQDTQRKMILYEKLISRCAQTASGSSWRVAVAAAPRHKDPAGLLRDSACARSCIALRSGATAGRRTSDYKGLAIACRLSSSVANDRPAIYGFPRVDLMSSSDNCARLAPLARLTTMISQPIFVRFSI
jgi:hypothetical protein